MIDPVEWFRQLYTAEIGRTTANVPGACCLSTIGLDGYPNARFLALKDIRTDGFIVTGPVTSRKGLELDANPKAALTFWWPNTEKQVRVQGDAYPISTADADKHFYDRPRESQLLALASRQGEVLDDPDGLSARYDELDELYREKTIPRPEFWSGYRIQPVRIEFLEFSVSRLHRRWLYQRGADGWTVTMLQP